MAKEIVSVTVDGKTRQGIAEMGFKLSQFIEHSYKKHQELQDTIRDLREIAEKMRTEDVSKQRIQKFIAAMNTIPAEKKHNLLNDLAMAVLGLEISVQRTAEILQQINEKLKKCDENSN